MTELDHGGGEEMVETGCKIGNVEKKNLRDRSSLWLQNVRSRRVDLNDETAARME